jgi:formate dehydrogenase major subunit
MSRAQRVSLRIDGREVNGEASQTILEVAREHGIYIPTLCFDPHLSPFGACRVCLVGASGARGPVPSCTTRVQEGMVIDTQDPTASRVARGVVELVLSEISSETLAPHGYHTELQKVAAHFGLSSSRFRGEKRRATRDESHPYIKMDMGQCIVCGRCVRACDEVQGAFALSFADRGFRTRIVAGMDTGLLHSSCVACGACAHTCPTGALYEPLVEAEKVPVRSVVTTCGYCGVGCSLVAKVRHGNVVGMDPLDTGPANHGHSCVKGRFAHQYVRSPERLTSPLMRGSDGTLQPCSWDDALDFVARRLLELRDRYGATSVGAVSSSRCTNEENYLLQKVFRAALGTNNIDNCSRVCHSPTSLGLIRSLGQSGGTGSFDDIERASVLLLTGANATEGHPVVGARIKEAVLRGAKLCVIDPRRIELSDYADVFLRLSPGTNVVVYNGLAHIIVRDGLYDAAFVEARVSGFEAFRKHIARYDPLLVSRVSGIPERELERAAHLFAKGGPGVIAYGLGVTEHTQGVLGVRTLANLALLTGNVGAPGRAILPLRGQNNVQGASDVGALPNVLSMYRPVADASVRAPFEACWGRSIPSAPGLTISDMLDAAVAGTFRGLYVFGEDPAQTDPNSTHVAKALSSLELLVVQDIFANETSRFAHVVLPGSSFLEKSGTFTNAERRVQLVGEAIAPPGSARRDLDILLALGEKLGLAMTHPTAAEVWLELASLTPELSGITHDRLREGGLQWPVPDAAHPGSPILYRDRFSTPSGRAELCEAEWEPPGERTSPDYPFILVTGRQLAHYNSGTQTRRTDNRTLAPEDLLELHPEDAARLCIQGGDVVEVSSPRGAIRVHACLTDRVGVGTVFLPFHFPETHTNLLTSSAHDPATGCPEFKVTAVRVARVAEDGLASPHTVDAFLPSAHDESAI